jgi:hypothetical protein
MTLKNLWSLQVGEVICADLIKRHLGEDYEVFIPLNNQLKDYDLVIMNQKTKKVSKIQVKESREYNLGIGDGWFNVAKDKVENKVVDFYIFLIYTAEEDKNKMKMVTYPLIVPSDVLLKKSEGKRARKGRYDYYFKIKKDHAYEDRDNREFPIDYTHYVDNFDLLK